MCNILFIEVLPNAKISLISLIWLNNNQNCSFFLIMPMNKLFFSLQNELIGSTSCK